MHDPGALHVLRLLEDSPDLKDATNALVSAVADSVHGNNTGVLAALGNFVDQSRKLSTEIGLVDCKTKNGRLGQQLAIHSLLLGEQASGYLHTGLTTTDPEQVRTNLARSMTVSQMSQSAGTHAVKLLAQ
jgi:hypothetical protein